MLAVKGESKYLFSFVLLGFLPLSYKNLSKWKLMCRAYRFKKQKDFFKNMFISRNNDLVTLSNNQNPSGGTREYFLGWNIFQVKTFQTVKQFLKAGFRLFWWFVWFCSHWNEEVWKFCWKQPKDSWLGRLLWQTSSLWDSTASEWIGKMFLLWNTNKSWHFNCCLGTATNGDVHLAHMW